MASFSVKDATTILTKLEAEVTNGAHVVGIVYLTKSFRVRLWHSNKRGELPSFVGHKWRQDLRLTNSEFNDLRRCPLSGPDAKDISRRRHGL